MGCQQASNPTQDKTGCWRGITRCNKNTSSTSTAIVVSWRSRYLRTVPSTTKSHSCQTRSVHFALRAWLYTQGSCSHLSNREAWRANDFLPERMSTMFSQGLVHWLPRYMRRLYVWSDIALENSWLLILAIVVFYFQQQPAWSWYLCWKGTRFCL